jgi:hypothetical protein
VEIEKCLLGIMGDFFVEMASYELEMDDIEKWIESTLKLVV